MHSSPNIGGTTKAALRGACVTRRMFISKSERVQKNSARFASRNQKTRTQTAKQQTARNNKDQAEVSEMGLKH